MNIIISKPSALFKMFDIASLDRVLLASFVAQVRVNMFYEFEFELPRICCGETFFFI